MNWSIDLPVREWIVLVLLTVAESALVWLLASGLLSLVAPESIRLSPWLVVGLVATATLVPRVLHDFGIWDLAYSGIILLAVAASILLAVKVTVLPDSAVLDSLWISDFGEALILDSEERRTAVWLLIFVVAAIWWRGRLGGEAGAESAIGLFRTGAAVAVVGLILHAMVDSEYSTLATSSAIVAYFSLTLAALAISRHNRAGNATTTSFALPILLPLVVILLGALVLVGLLTSDLVGTLDIVVGPLTWVLSIVFAGVILLLTGIALVFAIPLLWLLTKLPLNPAESETEIEPVSMGAAPDVMARATELPDIIRYVVAGFVLFVIFAGVAKFVLKLGKRPLAEETRQTTDIDASKLFGQLQSWLKSLLGRDGESADDPLASLRQLPDWQYTVAIREAYQQFLAAARDAGFPRRVSTTPSMFAESTTARFSEETTRDALERLTSTYERARYSQTPATSDEAAAAKSDSDVLRTAIRSKQHPVPT